MADDLAASKLVGYAVETASGRDALGAGKLAAYALEKASGRDAVGSGKLVAHAVLSDGVVLGWPHGHDLGLDTGAAPHTADNVLALIPLVL